MPFLRVPVGAPPRRDKLDRPQGCRLRAWQTSPVRFAVRAALSFGVGVRPRGQPLDHRRVSHNRGGTHKQGAVGASPVAWPSALRRACLFRAGPPFPTSLVPVHSPMRRAGRAPSKPEAAFHRICQHQLARRQDVSPFHPPASPRRLPAAWAVMRYAHTRQHRAAQPNPLTSISLASRFHLCVLENIEAGAPADRRQSLYLYCGGSKRTAWLIRASRGGPRAVSLPSHARIPILSKDCSPAGCRCHGFGGRSAEVPPTVFNLRWRRRREGGPRSYV